MKTIKTPTGETVLVTGSQQEADQLKALLDARFAFVKAYATSKGWPENLDELELPQIMEIRAQEGWKHPVLTGGEPS